MVNIIENEAEVPGYNMVNLVVPWNWRIQRIVTLEYRFTNKTIPCL